MAGATRVFAPQVEAARAAALQQAVADLRARGRVVVQALDAEQTPAGLGCTQQLVPAGGNWVCEPVADS